MKIIYKYIFHELVTPLIFGITAFVGIFVGTDLLFELTGYYSNYNITLWTLIRLFFLNLPAIIVLSFPMATLLATIMAYSRLSGDEEITAFKAGGISVYKLVVPALIMGLVLSLLTIGINEYIVPAANYTSSRIINEFRRGEILPETQSNLFLTPVGDKGPDYILYVQEFDSEKGIMNNVVLQNFEEGKPVTIIEARQGEWTDDFWQFSGGQVFHLQAGERVSELKFENFQVERIAYTPGQIAKMNKTVDDMNLTEFKEHIKLLEQQGKKTEEKWVEWHQRLSIPFANFIFTLVAVSMGIKPKRSGGSAMGMGLTIIIIFIYYVMMTVANLLGGDGIISPWMGAWIQNLVFFIIGGILLFKRAG